MRTNYISHIRKGFTLIEMMFVVLILSFVIVEITRTQQTRMQEQVIERAASDMLNWQLAVVNYYGQNNLWPNSLKDLTATNASVIYMPPAQYSLCSQFAVADPSHNPDCNTYGEYTGKEEGDYYVLGVPVNSNNTAKLLAARLPNSWTYQSKVYMAIPLPSHAARQKNHGWIVSAGLVSTTSARGNFPTKGSSDTSAIGTAVFLPNCPSGFEGHLLLSPLEYETNDYNWGIHIAMQVSGSTFGTEPSLSTDTNGHYYATVTDYPDVENPGRGSGGVSSMIRHLAYFMTICIPQTFDSTGKVTGSNWNTNYVDSRFEQDGECSPSWLAYVALPPQNNTNAACQYENPGDGTTQANTAAIVGTAEGY